jgi:hypothetical protein
MAMADKGGSHMFEYLYSPEYLIGLVIGWFYALAGGIALLFFASLSRNLALKTSRPEINVVSLKNFVYFVVGVVSLFYIASAVGFPILFIGETISWLSLAYVLVVVAEWRLVSWREARDFIFPWFYKWWEKKEIKTGKETDEENFSYFDLVKEGYRIRFGLEKSEAKKPKVPRKELTTAQVWKIQLWFIFGTALFLVLIGFIGKWLGY